MLGASATLAAAAIGGAEAPAGPDRVELAVLLLLSTSALAAIFLLAVVLLRMRRWASRKNAATEPTDPVPDAWAEAGRRLHVEPGGRERGDSE